MKLLAVSGPDLRGLAIVSGLCSLMSRVKLFVGFEVVEGKALEVGEEDVAGDLVATAYGLEVLDVVEGLGLGGFEAGSGGLVLDEDLALPEEVDEAVGTAELADGLFKGGDGAAGDVEDVEELVPEGLLIGLLAGGGGPVAGEGGGAGADFVPRELRHLP